MELLKKSREHTSVINSYITLVKKNRELASVISSYPALVISALFLMLLYKNDHMLTGDHLASANKNAAATISAIIWSVMFGLMLMVSILNTGRLIVKNMNQGKVIPTEATTNTSLFPFNLNNKILIILGAFGAILQSIFIALSIKSGGFALVVFWGVMLGITLGSYLYLYSEIKRRKANAIEAGGNA